MRDYLTPEWPAPSNVVAFTTLRDAIVDQIVLPVEAQQRHGNTVLRDAVLDQIALPAEPAWLKQVHGNIVVRADELTAALPEADASITFKSNTVCAVLTADCLPLLICDRAGTQVAAIHAGWRSLASGIIQKTCQQFTSPLQDCLVWLGPAIGPTAFEVGQDVLDSFIAQGWDPKQIKDAFVAQPHAKWLGNLYYLARITLQQQGFAADNIYGGEWCTFSDPQRFYSYRRSKDTGRMVSLIWIK